MVPQECHPAQGWADASARAGPPARPAQGWHLQTPGGDAPPPRAPERGQEVSPDAWDVGEAGGARPQPTKWRGIAPGEPPVLRRRRPPLEGTAPRAVETPCT